MKYYQTYAGCHLDHFPLFFRHCKQSCQIRGSGKVRDRLKDVLTVSLKAGEKRRVATVRLILAAIKDRDIAVRSDGQADGVSDEEILAILQKMVKQRRESTVMYQEGGRLEVAAQEEEITIIEEFLPQQMGQEAMAVAVGEVVAESGATSLKDMGSVMGLLKERYGARMDFTKVAGDVKCWLSR